MCAVLYSVGGNSLGFEELSVSMSGAEFLSVFNPKKLSLDSNFFPSVVSWASAKVAVRVFKDEC